MKHLIVRAGLICGLGAFATASSATELYTCATEPADQAEELGLTLCNASPTDALVARVDTDNLQRREGALVLEVDEGGVSQEAGFQPGDVIYRIGGVDVPHAQAAAENLALVQSRADTVVNFLRGGRPYRIKLRRE